MYIIINKKKYYINIMNTFYKRFKGLMFKKEKITDIYLFPKCSSIHTYFMKQNIDICIIDRNNIIRYLFENISPRKIIIKKGYSILEMPLETVKYMSIGEKLEFKK